MTSAPASDPVRAALPAMILGRFVGNVMFRAVFPYTRTIADELGTSLSTVGWLLSARELAGVSAYPLGPVIDGGRHRRWMVLMTGLGALSGLLLAFGTSVWIVASAMVLFGVAKPVYDTAMGAWIGENVPFARRGRVVGLTELSWAGAFLVGLPLLAPLVERHSWRAPYVVLFVAQAGAGLWLWRRLAPDRPRAAHAFSWRFTLTPGGIWLFPAVMALVVGHQLTVVTFGAWLDDEHGLDAGGLGLVAFALGVAELVGTLVVVAVSDRVGKRPTMIAGCLTMIPAMLLFGAASSTTASVVLVAIVLGGFEVAFIASLPLTTEISPNARAAVLGAMATGWTLMRAIGSVAGTVLYDKAGIGPVGVVGAVAVGICVVVIAVMFEEPAT